MDGKKLQQRLLERLIRTEAIQVRTSASDAPFWYTSGRPGPFYINVEKIAGQHAVAQILEKINGILISEDSASVKAKQVWDLISARLEADQDYQEAMSLVVDFYRDGNTPLPAFISGGERRDWFFSIPFSQLLKAPHLFLLKNGGYWLLDAYGKPLEQSVSLTGQPVLHVADIINTASSYLRYWLPSLQSLRADFKETLTVAVRSHDGVQALESQGVRVRTPLLMDLSVFSNAKEMNLINSFSYQDIKLYLESPKEWVRVLLQTQGERLIENFATASNLDRSRVQAFVSQDPYQIQNEFPAFFHSFTE